MPKDGTKNLRPMNRRTKEEQKEIAAKGGRASGEARRAKKLLRDELCALLEADDGQKRMCVALLRQAQRGSTKAFEVIRDTIGEKPAEKIEAEQVKPFEVNIKIIK